jgi:hypothetical protein
MPGFKSLYEYSRFAESVMCRGRYVFERQADDFLSAVHNTVTQRLMVLGADQALFRAQLGCEWRTTMMDPNDPHSDTVQKPEPYDIERMKPLRRSAREGRVNPKGIPCLYLSDNRETAMSETRPWIGSVVSLAEFMPVHELRLVNCCEPNVLLDHLLTPEFELDGRRLESVAWGEISRSFSTPVTPTDTGAEYAPTQILGDLFRRRGYDGIRYKSLLGSGHNFALFDLNCATLRSCRLYEVANVQFGFNEVFGDGYVCGEKRV